MLELNRNHHSSTASGSILLDVLVANLLVLEHTFYELENGDAQFPTAISIAPPMDFYFFGVSINAPVYLDW